MLSLFVQYLLSHKKGGAQFSQQFLFQVSFKYFMQTGHAGSVNQIERIHDGRVSFQIRIVYRMLLKTSVGVFCSLRPHKHISFIAFQARKYKNIQLIQKHTFLDVLHLWFFFFIFFCCLPFVPLRRTISVFLQHRSYPCKGQHEQYCWGALSTIITQTFTTEGSIFSMKKTIFIDFQAINLEII